LHRSHQLLQDSFQRRIGHAAKFFPNQALMNRKDFTKFDYGRFGQASSLLIDSRQQNVIFANDIRNLRGNRGNYNVDARLV
jgi:hypothetical protein